VRNQTVNKQTQESRNIWLSENSMKKILLINDLPGYGKVALAAMIPVLSHMKYEVKKQCLRTSDSADIIP